MIPTERVILQALLDKLLSVATEHNDRSCDFDVCKEVRDARAVLAQREALPGGEKP